MPKLLLFIFLTIFIFSSYDMANADSQLATKIQNAYGNINAFKADFIQTLTHKESGSIEKRKGTIQFQKPLRIRWQTKKPNEETLVVNSKEIWDYIPDEEIAYRYSPILAQDSRSIIQVITGQAKLDKDFDIKKEPNENGLVKLTLFPKEPTPDIVEAIVWTDPHTGIIHRASVTDFYGNINDIAFESFKPVNKIPDNQFTFTPPKGIDIEDRTDKKIQEKTLFK